ncbi:MAG: T9SS type A sorting domain-containing protein, partial [Candidatus Zixiibacteriota bacterium]
GGSEADKGNSVQQTSDGGYIIAGRTMSFGAGGYDAYLVKTDSSGNAEWSRTYGGSAYDYGLSVQQVSDGYIIAGHTQSFGAGSSDVYLVKTDSSGNTLWSRTYGGSSGDWGNSVEQTSDGGYIIAGGTQSFGAGLHDFYLVKTDSSGDTLWTHTYGGGSYEEAHSVQQTADGGYIIAGYTDSFGAGSQDCYVLETDSAGGTLWTRTYGGSAYDWGNSVQQTSDGGYIIAGDTQSFGAGNGDVYLIKTVGRVAIVCDNPSPWFCRAESFFFKLTVSNLTGDDVSGTLTFSGYSGYDCDPANVLISIPRARTYPPGVTEQYYRFKAPNAVGPGQYSASVGGTLGDVDLFCCMNTDIVQCGPWKSGGNSEWELVEASASEFESSLPASTSLSQCYPNPFNASTVIEYQLPEASDVKVEVYNLIGEKVATLVDSKQQAGYGSVVWDAFEVSSGVYFYKLTAGDFTETKRMLLVK